MKKLKIKILTGISDYDLPKLGAPYNSSYGSGYYEAMNELNKFLASLPPKDFIDIKFDRNYYEKSTMITIIYQQEKNQADKIPVDK